MILYLFKHSVYSFRQGPGFICSALKGFFLACVLTGIWGQEAGAVDFKTYLKGAQAEIERHKEIIREDPLDAVSYFELGLAYLALGKHEEEVEAYQEAIKLNIKYTEAYYNLSLAYDSLKDGPNAIKHMLQALNLYSKKRNHARIRAAQRQLKRLHSKYQITPEN